MMKYTQKVALLSCVFPLFLSASEPSAFGAGDLTSPKPYGLTSKEKVLLDTKKKLNKVAVKSNNQANELDSLRERIDGLQSVIESLSRKAHNNKVNLKKQQELSRQKNESISEYEQRLSEIVQANRASLEKQKIVMSEISLLIDSINANYVTKEEFNQLVNDVNQFKTLIAKELKERSVKKPAKNKLSKMKSSDIYKKANAYYKKKYYTDAIRYFEELIKRNYKPAYSHYMIGEMNYRRKNYANAISYYKKSSFLYSKARWMPRLMLHTAISMKKTGDNTHANAFFEAIVAKYPDSPEADKAREYIQP